MKDQEAVLPISTFNTFSGAAYHRFETGWFWYDETYEGHGPYKDFEEARSERDKYAQSLRKETTK